MTKTAQDRTQQIVGAFNELLQELETTTQLHCVMNLLAAFNHLPSDLIYEMRQAYELRLLDLLERARDAQQENK